MVGGCNTSKDADIMTVVKEKFNKKRVKHSSDHLVRKEGGTTNPM